MLDVVDLSALFKRLGSDELAWSFCELCCRMGEMAMDMACSDLQG